MGAGERGGRTCFTEEAPSRLPVARWRIACGTKTPSADKSPNKRGTLCRRGVAVDIASPCMGRLVAFVANMGKDTGSAKGLGVDATTALMVETTGMAKVFGVFNVYFVTPTEAAAVDANGNLVDPLTMNNIKVRRVDKDTAPFQLADGWNASSVFGLQYSLTARPKQGEPLQGELVSDRPNGEVY